MAVVICCSTEFKWVTSCIINSIRATEVPSLHHLLGRIGERLFCITVLLEIYDDTGSEQQMRYQVCLACITADTTKHLLAMEPLILASENISMEPVCSAPPISVCLFEQHGKFPEHYQGFPHHELYTDLLKKHLVLWAMIVGYPEV
jgi:hypothetical protein